MRQRTTVQVAQRRTLSLLASSNSLIPSCPSIDLTATLTTTAESRLYMNTPTYRPSGPINTAPLTD